MFDFFKKNWFISLVVIIFLFIFNPLITSGQIPFSSNLLASFFNPWAQEKFPGWSQGIPNKPLGIDDLRIFYPQRSFTVHMQQMGHIPLWNPYNYSGNFHAGLSETAVFYPLFYLFLFLPQLPSWILLQILEPVIAIVGMYLFLRLLFSSKIPAAYGAIVFGFSGVVMTRMVEGISVGHTLVWLPLTFYGLLAYSQKEKLRSLGITTLALCFSLLAGWFQYAFYIVAASFLYAVFLFLGKPSWRKILLFSPFIFFPILTLFHIVPSLEMLNVGSRSATTTKELLDLHLMPWYHILTYLSPDFWGNPGAYNFFGKSEYKESILYIGIIPFLISFFSFGFLKKGAVWFFAIVSTVGTFLGLDIPISRAILSLPIPVVSSFLPNRIFLLATFGLSVLSAFGFSYLLEYKNTSKRLILIVTVVVGSLFVLINGYTIAVHPVSHMPSLIQSAFQNYSLFQFTKDEMGTAIFIKSVIFSDIFLLLFFVVFSLKNWMKMKFFIAGIFLLTIIGQVYFAQKYIPWSLPKFVFPMSPVFSYLQKNQGIDRFISLGQGYISSDIPLFYGLYSPDGVGSMYIKRYGELLTYVQTKGEKTDPIPRIESRINPSTKALFTYEDPYMLRFMQIDGIRNIVKLTNEQSDPEGITNAKNTDNFSLSWQNKTWQIFTYTKALPRVFWTNQFSVAKNDKETLTQMFDFSSSPEKIVLIKNPSLSIDPVATGSVNVISYQPWQIVLKTHATGNGLIFLSDNFAKDFYATVDGKKREILLADYTFRAIAIEKGDHVVILSLSMFAEVLSFVVSGISLVCIIALGMYAKKKHIFPL